MSLVKVNEKLSRIMQNLFLKIANQSRVATSLTSQSPILVDRIFTSLACKYLPSLF
ncbi:hypothetical protein [Helicobacter pullorum]|nr:hypothetical protein [Helicobacter pullorum]